MTIRLLMKDGTRYVGELPEGTSRRQLLRTMQGQRVLALHDDEGMDRLVNTDSIAVVEILPESKEKNP